VVKAAKRAVKWWILKKAKECPDPLPKPFFCSEAPQEHWGRGVALEFNGRSTGEFSSRSPQNPVRALRPGNVVWLTCSSYGATGQFLNGVVRSNIWYRLPDGLWASGAWLYTGAAPQYRAPGVAPC
jgi:hypothetical protein